MAIPYTNIFTKIGKLGGMLGQVNTLRGTTIPGQIATLEGYYAALNPSVADGLYQTLTSFQLSQNGFLSALKTLASNTLITDVDAATTLPDTQLATALTALISGMRTASESVSAATISATVTAGGSNTGNAAVICGLRTALGYAQDNAFAESVTATVTGDAQSGTATLNQEPIRFQGQPATSSSLDSAYPAGSGASLTINCVDAGAAVSGGNGQWISNGTFETFTVANIPDGWTIGVGSAGTQVLKTTAGGTFYDGIAALSLVGDSSTLTALSRPFTSSPAIAPYSQYAFNLWAKVSSVPAAGVLQIALTDGSGTILTDGAGNNSAVTFSLPGLTTSFAPLNGFLRTPRVLPAVVNLRIRLSTALSTGSNLYIDRLSFTQPTQLYRQGPNLAAFSGSTPMVANDTYTVVVANNYADGFQRLFDRLFSMKTLGLLLPTSGSPTQSDALIA